MKWALLVVAIAGAVVGCVAVIGMTLPQDHVVSRIAKVSAPPDSVWSIITNVNDFPAWRKDVKSVEQIRGASLFTWRENMAHGKLTFEATTIDAPTHFVARIVGKDSGFGGSWDYIIEPDGTGSKITITEYGKVFNPVFRFLSHYVIGQAATLDKYLSALTARTGDQYSPGAA